MVDGRQGFGRGQHVFNETLTTLEQVAEAESSAKASTPDVVTVSILFFTLWRTEEEEEEAVPTSTESRWQWLN